ncbi:MAG TPA: STAS domain-containing protein [Bdellovibrionales bacterium]|nr:STAS domain-containing protein [Bdellovibrionales bacterium]
MSNSNAVNYSQEKTQTQPWSLVPLRNRLDAAALSEVSMELGDLMAAGHHRLALDLKNNRFICLQAIYYLVGLAEALAAIGGEFVLIACAEKTKRHFEIYGSLKHIRVVRSESELSGEINRVSRSVPLDLQELP